MTNNTTQTFATETGVILVIHGICQNSTVYCVIVTLTYFLLIAVGIILNVLVCHVMVRSQRYIKSMSCFFITHLGVVEIVYRVALTPSLIYLSLPFPGSRSSIPCKVNYFISSSCRAAIFGSLVVIAYDRYRNIVHPLSSLKQNKRPFKVVMCVWFYAVASSSMFLYTAQQVPLRELPEGKVVKQREDMTTCDVIPNYIGGISVTVSMVMTFVVPLVTIIIAYTGVFISLRRRCQSGLVHKAAAKSKSKAAKMLVIVVSGFVICWAPSITMTTIRSFGGLNNTLIGSLVAASISVNLLVLCSSLANPLIYAFYSANFKTDMAKLCCSFHVKIGKRVSHSESYGTQTKRQTETSL